MKVQRVAVRFGRVGLAAERKRAASERESAFHRNTSQGCELRRRHRFSAMCQIELDPLDARIHPAQFRFGREKRGSSRSLFAVRIYENTVADTIRLTQPAGAVKRAANGRARPLSSST